MSRSLSANRALYWEKGYIVIQGIFNRSEVQGLQDEVYRLWSISGLLDPLNLRTEFRRSASGEFVADRLDPMLDLSDIFQATVLAPKLLDALRAIFDATPQLLKCKLIRKDPGTGGYLHHQDFLYWRWLDRAPDTLFSVGISINESNEQSGGIEFFPSMHHALLPPLQDTSKGDFAIDLIDLSTGEIPQLDPGDIVVFHGLTPHRSAPNRSTAARSLLLPSYAVGDEPDLYARYYHRETRRRGQVHEGFEGFDQLLRTRAARAAAQ